MNKTLKAITYASLLLFLLCIFPNCSKKAEKSKVAYINQDQTNNIKITITKINEFNYLPLNRDSFKNKKEEIKFKNKQNKKIFKQYQPLWIKIENSSDVKYSLNAKNINLPLTSTKIIAKKMTPKILKPLFTGAFIGSVIGAVISLSMPLVSIGCTIGSGIGAANWQQEKKQIFKGYKNIALPTKGSLIIPDHCSTKKIIFIKKKKLKKTFALKIFNMETKEVIYFNIKLSEPTLNL